MPAPDWYHPLDYGNVTALRRVSLRARWTYVELFCAELGQKHGLVEVRPALIAAECDVSRAHVEADLHELNAAGLIAFDEQHRLAYHVGALLRHTDNPKAAIGWRKQIEAMPLGCARSAALSELDGIPYAYRTDTVSTQEQEQEQERKPEREPVAPVGAASGMEEPQKAATTLKPLPAALLDAYRTLLKHLPQPRDPPTANIRALLDAAAKRDPDADLWVERFHKVAGSRHHMGEGDSDWKADLAWVLGPKNSTKIDAMPLRDPAIKEHYTIGADETPEERAERRRRYEERCAREDAEREAWIAQAEQDERDVADALARAGVTA